MDVASNDAAKGTRILVLFSSLEEFYCSFLTGSL